MQLSKLGAEYSHMLDSLPASETQVLSAARSLEIQGDAARACTLLQRAVARHPSANLRKMLAALHLKHGRFDESARLIEQVLQEAASDVPSLLLLAEAQVKGGRHDKAYQTLRRAERFGASKLRIFKIERQIEDAPTEPQGPATGPPPPLAGVGGDPSDSAVFEDESFSDLSSFQLADGAADVTRDDTPGIFDTLVDSIDDDPADRSFDDFLSDLGVPVDDESPTDPDRTGSMPAHHDDQVAERWGIDASETEEASPEDATAAISFEELPPAPERLSVRKDRRRQHTPRLSDSPYFQGNSVSNANFPDEKTEVLDLDREAPPVSPNSSSSAEPASKHAAAPRLERQPREVELDLELDHDPWEEEDRRPLPPTVQQGRRDRRRPTGQSRSIAGPVVPEAEALNEAQAPTGAPGDVLTSRLEGIIGRVPWKFAVPSLAALLIVAIAGVIFAASSSAASAVKVHLTHYRSVTATDTYQGYLAGEEALEEALVADSFLGASADQVFAHIGLMNDARSARHEALAELAELKAMIEYRYERLDTRQSGEIIERATSTADGDPRLDVARSYRLMAEGRADEAVALLEVTRKNFPGFTDGATALLHAQLDENSLQSASMTAKVLTKLENPSVHQHYVLGLFESRQGKDAADARLRHIIETLSPKHVSARIARSYTIREGDDPEGTEGASALLDEVFGPLHASASPMQRAEAHIALGALYLADDARARAEEQFRKAIKIVPARSSVYMPLVELYSDDGRFDKSLELIDDAIAKSANSLNLVLRKAQIFWLTGRAETALRVLRQAEDGAPQDVEPGEKDRPKERHEALGSARAKWLEGMALLDLDRLDEASEALAAAAERSDEFAPGHAYRLMAKELESDEERNELSEELEQVLEKFSTDPHVLRAGALAAMHVAKISRSRTSRKNLLERAHDLLEQAVERGGNKAVLLYDLCRQQMLSDRGQEASISCRKAKAINNRYLPGLLTLAEVERRRGQPEEALELLSKLDERFVEKPRISQMKADAHLERFEIEAAEEEINRWAGTEYAQSTLHLIVEGRLAFARDRYTSALGYFQRAHKQDPNNARAGLYYAHTLTRLGEHERAEALVKRYLTDLEGEPVAWLIFGEIRRRQGRFSDARENLGLALQKLGDAISPPWRTSQAYTQLAQTWADRYGFDHRYVGRYLYRGAERGDENYPALNAARGIYHLKRRRPDEDKAAEAFEKVIEVTPFNCPVLVSLREIYQNQDADEALERVDALHLEHCED